MIYTEPTLSNLNAGGQSSGWQTVLRVHTAATISQGSFLLPGNKINKEKLFVNNTWKCFVRPGVADTDTFLSPRIVLMVELLPTLG